MEGEKAPVRKRLKLEEIGPDVGDVNESAFAPTSTPDELEDGIKSYKISTWSPFSTLPELVWLNIFADLTDPDLESLINAHSEWRGMYSSKKRVDLLLPKVLSVLNTKAPSSSPDQPFLPWNDALNLRLVSKSWNEGFQKFLQIHPSNFDILESEEELKTFDEKEHIFQKLRRDWRHRKVVSFSVETAFYSDIGAPPSITNPVGLHSRHLSLANVECGNRQNDAIMEMRRFMLELIRLQAEALQREIDQHFPECFPRCPSQTPGEDWRTFTTQLLEEYGREIWHFRVEGGLILRPIPISPVANYEQLQTWLSLMPNLKTLNLKYELCVNETKRMFPELKSKMEQVPISPLSQLQSLKMVNLPHLLFNELLRSLSETNAVQQISIKSSEGHFGFENYQFNQLASLTHLKDCFISVGGLKDFDLLEETLPPLQLNKLYFEMNFTNHQNWEELIKRIFNFLSGLAPKAQELKLKLPLIESAPYLDEEVFMQLSLNLSNLHLKFSKLKSLHIFVNVPPTGQLLNSEPANYLPYEERLKRFDNFGVHLKKTVLEGLPTLKEFIFKRH